MPCVVCLVLEDYLHLKIVKKSWCENLKSADPMNKEILPTDPVKIFYSTDKAQKANFNLETLDELDEERAACYDGHVLEVCGMYIYIYRNVYFI